MGWARFAVAWFGRQLGLGTLVGFILFVPLTVAVTPWLGDAPLLSGSSALAILGFALVALVVPVSRSTAIGFFLGLALWSLPEQGVFTRVWRRPIGDAVARAARPALREWHARQEQRAALNARKLTLMPLDAGDAVILARHVAEQCVGDPASGSGCGVLRLLEAPTGPSPTPQLEETPGDRGWRWTIERSGRAHDGYLVVVAPDPVLGAHGPVIAIDQDDVLTRQEAPGSPRYVVYSPVPAMRRVRECLLTTAAAEHAGTVTDWQRVPFSDARRRACPGLDLKQPVPAAEGVQTLEVPAATPEVPGRQEGRLYRLVYRVLEPGAFELRTAVWSRRFLLTSVGTLHVTHEPREARTSDGPPLGCEIDPRAPCS
jgi:hypothetical protein